MVLGVPFEIVDMADIVEDIDSFEAFLPNWSEGRLGGRAGEGWLDSRRGGSRGGGGGFAGFWLTLPVLVILIGGGRTPSLLGPFGSFPMPLLVVRA